MPLSVLLDTNLTIPIDRNGIFLEKNHKWGKNGLSNSIFKKSLFHSNTNDKIHELNLYISNYSYK